MKLILLTWLLVTALAFVRPVIASEKEQLVQFPAKSIGTLLAISTDAELSADVLRAKEIGQAAGKVGRPAGTSFGLKLNFQTATNLSLLKTLRADDLVALDSDHMEVDGNQLKELSGLTGLRRLNLKGSEVNDEQLQALQNMHKLQYLNLAQSLVTGSGLKSLQDCHQLRNLDLAFDKIEGPNLKNLHGFPLLTHVDLTNALLNDADLITLAQLKELVSLKLGGNKKLDDEGVQHLAGLQKLTTLYLNDTNASVASLSTFKKLSKLDHLTVSGPRLNAKELETIKAQLPHCYVKGSGSNRTPRLPVEIFAPLH